MENSLRTDREKTAIFLIGIFVVLGLIPLGLHVLEGWKPGLGSFLGNDFFAIVIHPATAIGLIICFLIGALLCVFIGKTIGIIALMPLLFTAFLPLIDSKTVSIPIPSGMVLMSLEDCPVGWKKVDKLAGKFPIGAAAEAGFSLLTSGGRTTVSLKAPNLPSHRHKHWDIFYAEQVGDFSGVPRKYLASVFGGYGKKKGTTDKDNVGIRQRGDTWAENRPAQPINITPPYLVVNFCTNSNSL